MPTQLRRKLQHLDVAYAYSRHITGPLGETFLGCLEEALKGSSDVVKHRNGTELSLSAILESLQADIENTMNDLGATSCVDDSSRSLLPP